MKSPVILFITPPMVQVNTPYPAMPWLAGFLKSRGIRVLQADLSLSLFHRLFSNQGLRELHRQLGLSPHRRSSPSVRHFLNHADQAIAWIEPVIRFLQGKDESLARAFASRNILPEGPRFDLLRNHLFLWETFGAASFMDRARHLASLFIDDLADAIREGTDPRFTLARWAESTACIAPSFEPLRQQLEGSPTWVDRCLDRLTDQILRAADRPALVALTIPFPGALYGALRIARRIRRHPSPPKIAIGGAFVSTELRSLYDPRIFDYVDAVVLDEGEWPLLHLAHWATDGDSDRLIRTFIRRHGEVVFVHHPGRHCRPPSLGSFAPDYESLPLEDYVPLAESAASFQNLWSDARWLKLPVGRGCSWRRCRFCDLSLPAIAHYETTPPDRLAALLERLIIQTGRRGFHFTDEALPPDYLHALCTVFLQRNLRVAWWSNIRFETGFSASLVRLMARSGCVAITGGLETVNNRTLRLLNKGITVREAFQACARFARAGIHVHAYLMHETPTQTVQETVDALELIRQAFAENILHSAYWHRFALSVHSPIAHHPDRFGLRLLPLPFEGFARNTLPCEEPHAEPQRAALGEGLQKAVFNYTHGVGFDRPVTKWFPFRIPRPSLPPDTLRRWIHKE